MAQTNLEHVTIKKITVYKTQTIRVESFSGIEERNISIFKIEGRKDFLLGVIHSIDGISTYSIYNYGSKKYIENLFKKKIEKHS